MDYIELLIDLHRDNERQGPGRASDTRLAIDLSGLRGATALRIADVGCGTGASTLVLAQELGAQITAVDLAEDFLRTLETNAQRAGLADRVTTLACSMDELPFEASSLDAIWSEGAIYNIGFANGIPTLRRYLKPGGVLAASELIWLTDQRPAELTAHWVNEYAEVDTASAKIRLLEQHGYTPLGYFALSEESWLEHYYRPVQLGFDAFLIRHKNSEAARAVIEAEKKEIELYERYSRFFGYGYFIAQKLAD